MSSIRSFMFMRAIWYIYLGSTGTDNCGKRIAEDMGTFGHATSLEFSDCVVAVISSTLKNLKTGSREYGCLRYHDIAIFSALLDNLETVGWEYPCLTSSIRHCVPLAAICGNRHHKENNTEYIALLITAENINKRMCTSILFCGKEPRCCFIETNIT